MCGRFALLTTDQAIAAMFDLVDVPEIQPRYNIAPSQPVLSVAADRDSGARVAEFLRWGLVPHWAKDPSIGNRMINARAETLADKPSFRGPLRHNRCLIPASGFYEWRKQGTSKQPMFVRMADGQPFALAGLWATYTPPDGSELRSCTIITTEPNSLLATIHNRMPAILDPVDYDTWLDPAIQHPPDVLPLLVPFEAEKMDAYPVSTVVNSPANDVPDCLKRIDR